MTSIQQRAELQRRIWQIANDVRGAVDGWDFKQYVLGTLFYRFISENFASYIEGGDDSIHYAELHDSVITPDIKDDAIKTKGYFIYPSQLFAKVAAGANTNESLNTDLAAIFAAIDASANGYPSERDIKGLFADFDTTSNRLGNTVKDKNLRLAAVLKGVAELNFADFEGSNIDLFGDAYEFLISNYAANAGKSGGEFFTPQHVSKLIAQLAMHKQTSVNKIYDPACGSGSLLLQAKKHFDAHIIEDGFFGQEINHTTYNLARMNMFLHNINYDKFNVQLGNTLIDPHFGDDKPFDAIVSNPPYSVKWIGSDDPTLINDDRFAPAGVLAPKSKADFAFVLHALMRYVNGKYIRDADYVAPKSSRRYHDHTWTTTKELPCGRLRLVAYSPYWRASWQTSWQELKNSSLSREIPQMIKAIEDAAIELVEKLKEADRQAEIARLERLAEEEKRRQEEDRRRIQQSIKDSKDHLGQIIQSWGNVMTVERFLRDVEERAKTLPLDESQQIMERLRLAREFVGTQNPLDFFMSWKTPLERYQPLASRNREATHETEDDDEDDELGDEASW